MCRRTNPDEETTDWRAVCGRTARTVRRAGTAKAVPDPYQRRPFRTNEVRILRKAPDISPGKFTIIFPLPKRFPVATFFSLQYSLKSERTFAFTDSAIWIARCVFR